MTFVVERPTGTKAEIYRELALQARGLLDGEHDAIANAANLASLIFNGLDDLNWAGFFFLKESGLVLGPFQGKPACVRIAMGKGVCGTAAATRETVVVEDVNEFPGHIACDVASQSEIVVPLVKGGRLVGVLDIDSPKKSRFTKDDAAGFEILAKLWLDASDL
jgi:GAF domain-containing protein